jgi:hypothetical protein
LAFGIAVSLVDVQDSSPQLACGLCAWTHTAVATQRTEEIIDSTKKEFADGKI